MTACDITERCYGTPLANTSIATSTATICRLAAYVILGINMDGRKEVLTIEVGQNGSAKYWLSVLNKKVITSCRAAHDPLPNRDIMR